MSIAPTRKVGSSSSGSRADKAYTAARLNTQFVEMIDTNNNVLVREDTTEHHNSNPYSQEQEKNLPEEISADRPYVASSIEALAVSGVFDETPPENDSANHHKVGVYGNNQAIIKDEELERTGRSYLKHFYEKNEHIEDVDELV